MTIDLDSTWCPQNHLCPAIRVCPVQAISQKGYQAPIINQAKCIECKKCIRACPMGVFQSKN